MLKLIGALLVITGGTGLGLSYRQEMQDRLYHIKCLHRIIELLESEVGYSKASLPEACGMIATRLSEPYSVGLNSIREIMNSNRGLTFSFVWKQEMGRCLQDVNVSTGEKEMFLNFPEGNGYIDNLTQLKAIEKCKRELDKAISVQEEKIENKSKVVMSMGLIGGLFITIVLL